MGLFRRSSDSKMSKILLAMWGTSAVQVKMNLRIYVILYEYCLMLMGSYKKERTELRKKHIIAGVIYSH